MGTEMDGRTTVNEADVTRLIEIVMEVLHDVTEAAGYLQPAPEAQPDAVSGWFARSQRLINSVPSYMPFGRAAAPAAEAEGTAAADAAEVRRLRTQ